MFPSRSGSPVALLTILILSTFSSSAAPLPVEMSRMASFCDSSHGVENWREGPRTVKGCTDGDWLRYDSLDFLDGAYSTLEMNIGSLNEAGTIEVRLDATEGQLIGSLNVPGTERYENIQSYSVPLQPVSGVHNCFLVFKNTSCWLDGLLSFKGTVEENTGTTPVTYFVAVGGSNSNPGTEAEPLRTIQHAAGLMKPGDRCVIRQGVYRESVVVPVSGTPAAPITFEAYPGEDAVISGLEPVTGWSVHEGSIYKAPLAWDLGPGTNQLFINGEMVDEARFPNTEQLGDTAVRMLNRTAHEYHGTIFNPTVMKIRFYGEGDTVANINEQYHTNPEVRAKPPDFFKGSLFTGRSPLGWIGTCGLVTGSEGRRFHVDKTSWPSAAGMGYGSFIGGLQLLDKQGEWAFRDGTVYLWCPGDMNPNEVLVEAKRRTLAFDCSYRQNIVLRGLKFFGCSVTMNSAEMCLIENCHGRYISHSYFYKPVPENLHFIWDLIPDMSDGRLGFYISGNNNTIRRCSIAWSAGSGVILAGSRNKVVDCLIHHCSYQGTYHAPVFIENGFQHQIHNNTLYHCGRSTIHHSRSSEQSMLLNHCYKAGFINPDAGIVYMYTNAGHGSELAYNWFHDQYDYEHMVRFDSDNFGWTVHHNVFWKGKGHVFAPYTASPGKWTIYNNTIIDSITNTSHFIPGTNELVCNGKPEQWGITDAAGRNFTLSGKESPAFDAGTTYVPPARAKEQMTDDTVTYVEAITLTDFEHEAPDLGAYEFGGENWKPGHTWTETAWKYPPDPQPIRPHGPSRRAGLSALPRITVRGSWCTIATPRRIPYQVRIIDARGAVTARYGIEPPRQSSRIPLRGLPSGVFQIVVSYQGEKQAMRFIRLR